MGLARVLKDKRYQGSQMDPQEPTGQISEEEYRRMVLQLLETIMNDISDLTRCVERARPDAPGRGHYLRVVKIPEPMNLY